MARSAEGGWGQWLVVRHRGRGGRLPGGRAGREGPGAGLGRTGTSGQRGAFRGRRGAGFEDEGGWGLGEWRGTSPGSASPRLTWSVSLACSILSSSVCLSGLSAGLAPPWTVAASPTFSSPHPPCRLSGPLVTGPDLPHPFPSPGTFPALWPLLSAPLTVFPPSARGLGQSRLNPTP